MQSLQRSLGVLSLILLGLASANGQEGSDPQPAAGQAAKAEVGKPAPDFELKDTTGKTYTLSALKDKIVVLEWVNQDCPYSNDTPRTGALPKMKELSRKYAEKGVVWLAIDSTWGRTPEQDEKYRTAKEIPHPILLDSEGKVGRAYGAQTTPHMFIINKGTLVYAGAHWAKDNSRDYISESLDAILAGKEVPLAQTKSYGCTVKYKGAR